MLSVAFASACLEASLLGGISKHAGGEPLSFECAFIAGILSNDDGSSLNIADRVCRGNWCLSTHPFALFLTNAFNGCSVRRVTMCEIALKHAF